MNIKTEIEKLVSEGNLGEAIKKLRAIDTDDDKFKDSITSLSARHSQWENAYHAGIGHDTAEFNKISQSILYYLGKYEGLTEQGARYTDNLKHKKTSRRNITIIGLGMILGIITSLWSWSNTCACKEELNKTVVELNERKVESNKITDENKIEPANSWNFSVGGKYGVFNMDLNPKYFEKYYQKGKKMVFVVYKSDPSVENAYKTKIQISPKKMIVNPSMNNHKIAVKCYEHPEVDVGDRVLLKAYIVPSDINLSECRTMGDIVEKGGDYIFFKGAMALIDFKNSEEIKNWIDRLPKDTKEEICLN